MLSSQKVEIKKTEKEDAPILTEIAFAAKKHWDYPENYFEIWKDELTVTEEYIKQNVVFYVQAEDEVLGFYSIFENKADFYSGEIHIRKGFWLEHLFIKPKWHNRGIGKMLVNHALEICRKKRISKLFIFVDPFATGFYEKQGARFLYDSKSSIQGRTIPVYELKVK